LKKSIIFISCVLLGSLALVGCGKQNPMAPQAKSQDNSRTTQTLRPGGVIYEASLSGDLGQKPWYWFDADDDASYNAKIRVNYCSKRTSVVMRVNGSTWGKVRTFPISYANTANATIDLRIGVPARTSSVAWKILIQEEGGQWRNWVLQNSTTDTGYKDYDMTSILQAVNAGTGTFTIEIVVEGAVGQSIELSDLYVFKAGEDLPAGDPYWYELSYLITNTHTSGWYDETTNPGFHAVIHNDWGHASIVGDAQLGGKVESPIIPWNPQHCRTLYLHIFNPSACFSVWVQEQNGQYRQWQVSKTYSPTQGWICDLTSVTDLAAGAPFSITISDVFGTLYLESIYLY
jgi:hypothetical protein